jgi:hypothetical protein
MRNARIVRVAAGVVILLMALNFSGFSYKNGSWLSDRDLIRIAADEEASSKRGTYRYSSGEDLIAGISDAVA